jgi:flagellar basal-body rod modification protein FlgD
MQARAAMPVEWQGQPVTLSPAPAGLADETVLIVRDANGTVVARSAIPVSAAPFAWNGEAGGATLPHGRYSFELESRADGAVVATEPVALYAPVIEARSSASGTMLVMPGGIEVDAAKVSGLRRP